MRFDQDSSSGSHYVYFLDWGVVDVEHSIVLLQCEISVPLHLEDMLLGGEQSPALPESSRVFAKRQSQHIREAIDSMGNVAGINQHDLSSQNGAVHLFNYLDPTFKQSEPLL